MIPPPPAGEERRGAPWRARAWAAAIDMSMMALPVLVLAAAVFLRLSGVPSPKLTTLAALGVIATLVIGVAQVGLAGAAGRSYGKLAMRLRIVRVDGGRPSFGAAGVLRTLIPGLLWIAFPPFAFADVAVGWLRRDRRCLHDLMAGTRVVPE